MGSASGDARRGREELEDAWKDTGRASLAAVAFLALGFGTALGFGFGLGRRGGGSSSSSLLRCTGESGRFEDEAVLEDVLRVVVVADERMLLDNCEEDLGGALDMSKELEAVLEADLAMEGLCMAEGARFGATGSLAFSGWDGGRVLGVPDLLVLLNFIVLSRLLTLIALATGSSCPLFPKDLVGDLDRSLSDDAMESSSSSLPLVGS